MMKWSDIKSLIGNAAPLLGAVVGGPAGATVGSMISSALGVDNTPDAVSAAIKSDPEAFVKLKQLELDNQKDLRSQAFKILDIELKDVQNARENNKHSRMPAIICILISLMVFFGALALFTLNIPDANKEIAYLLFGTLLAKWGDSIAYWVGTTRSSAEKSKGLAR